MLIFNGCIDIQSICASNFIKNEMLKCIIFYRKTGHVTIYKLKFWYCLEEYEFEYIGSMKVLTVMFENERLHSFDVKHLGRNIMKK